ncbi:hypothetical protein KEM55_001559 [Ascosphaera atra]|nr:hypothetical protein KEM55_001559 [Ascosphaera atra]
MFGTVVLLATRAFTKEEQIKEIEKFFADKDTKGYDKTLEQSIDAVRAKAKWSGRDKEDVEAWLRENGYLS